MTILEDEFLTTKLINRLKDEFKKEQLEKGINEISYLNSLQEQILINKSFTSREKEELDFLKKLNNARKNIQIQA